MNSLVIAVATVYLLGLFALAYFAEWRAKKGRSVVNNGWVYTLSLAVYCTAWTYYGSVGRAATQGVSFLPVYLGPTLFAPLWPLVLRKMILISKAQRITSVADFISARYGKSVGLGILATLIAIIGVTPYIALQLKAIVTSLDSFSTKGLVSSTQHFFFDASFFVAIALAFFTIWFGARRLDPNERHEGLVAAIAFESVVKLSFFLAVGIFVTFGLFDGFGQLFQLGLEQPAIRQLYSLETVGIDAAQWFWLCLISALAMVALPRQFHVAVVENTNPQFVNRASWLFPLYLLLINLFVLPIAIAGVLLLPATLAAPDNYVLALPLFSGRPFLALVVTIGGFSAATSMVIVEVTALSIMFSNNVVLPLLLQVPRFQAQQHPNWILAVRRMSIVGIVYLAYIYFRVLGSGYSLVSIGLVSFLAVAQFAPSMLAGMYWRGGTRQGAIAGMVVGFVLWAFTSPAPTLNFLLPLRHNSAVEFWWGLEWLHPHALFGLKTLDPMSHASFWSLGANTLVYLVVSLCTRPTRLEVQQADFFVNIHHHQIGNNNEPEVMRRQAKVQDLSDLMTRFLGATRAQAAQHSFEQQYQQVLNDNPIASPELVHFVEINLSGAIGAASAKILVNSVAKPDPISLEEMFTVLEQTQEIMLYSQILEKKSTDLERTTRQLQRVNAQLQELDRLKADFIATVTHELRTPITSIKALAKILYDHPNLPSAEKDQFLQLIVGESERIARLINQVLDLDALQSPRAEPPRRQVDFRHVIAHNFYALQPLMAENHLHGELELPKDPQWVAGDADRLAQVVTNLIGNAIKFGQHTIKVALCERGQHLILQVCDDGKGIDSANQEMIFEKFRQIQDDNTGKPQGSGLGLFICRTIVDQHQGTIRVNSSPGSGACFEVALPKFQPLKSN